MGIGRAVCESYGERAWQWGGIRWISNDGGEAGHTGGFQGRSEAGLCAGWGRGCIPIYIMAGAS